MGNYAKRTDYSVTSDFRVQVSYGMQNASQMILGESPDTPYHVLRCAFAQKVQRGDFNLNTVSLLATTDLVVGPVIDVDGIPTDAEVQNAINSLWNQWSGVVL